MTVKDLITELLEMPLDSEIKLSTRDAKSVTTYAAFNIDDVEKWCGGFVYINFTDWRNIGGTQHDD